MERWEQFLKELEEEMGTAVIQKWLRPLKVVDFDASNLYLKAENAFQVLWFEKEIRPLTTKRFLNQRQKPIRIHIQAEDLPQEQAFAPKPVETHYHSTPLDPSATFESFHTAPQNQLLVEILKSLPTTLGNPVFIYGPPGVGKTHLLMATAALLLSKGWKVLYTPAETFTEHVVGAIRRGNVEPLRKTYRNVDALLIDDIHTLSGKAATQEEFFHTFNQLHSRGCPLILSSQLAPSRITGIEARLISRFEWGLSYEVSPLTEQQLQEVARTRALQHRLSLSDEQIAELTTLFASPPQALLQAIDALALRLSSSVHTLSSEEMRRVLQDLIHKHSKHPLTPEEILMETALYFQLEPRDLQSDSQSARMAGARHIAMYLCRKMIHLSYPLLGKLFDRDHSTVLSGVKTIEKKKGTDPEVARALYEITQRLSKEQNQAY